MSKRRNSAGSIVFKGDTVRQFAASMGLQIPERPELSEVGRAEMRAKSLRNGGADREVYADKSDEWVANAVRMLTTRDLDHEAIVCAAGDRIMRLSLEVERLMTASK